MYHWKPKQHCINAIEAEFENNVSLFHSDFIFFKIRLRNRNNCTNDENTKLKIQRSKLTARKK